MIQASWTSIYFNIKRRNSSQMYFSLQIVNLFASMLRGPEQYNEKMCRKNWNNQHVIKCKIFLIIMNCRSNISKKKQKKKLVARTQITNIRIFTAGYLSTLRLRLRLGIILTCTTGLKVTLRRCTTGCATGCDHRSSI